MRSNSSAPRSSYRCLLGVVFCGRASPARTSSRKSLATSALVIPPRSTSWAAGAASSRAVVMKGLQILRQPEARELPAGAGVKEIPVRGADVRGWRNARSSSKDELIAHELAVVLAQWAGLSAVAGVGTAVAARPRPDIAKHLAQRRLFTAACPVCGGIEHAGFRQLPPHGEIT